MVPVVLHGAGDSQPVPLRVGKWYSFTVLIGSRNRICRFSGANPVLNGLKLEDSTQINLRTKRWTKEELQIHSVDPGIEIEGSSLKWTDHSSIQTMLQVKLITVDTLTWPDWIPPVRYSLLLKRVQCKKTKGELSKQRKHKPGSKGVSSPFMWVETFSKNISK